MPSRMTALAAACAGAVGASLRVLADVAVFRLRRLEMANVFAGISIAVALRMPAGEIALRTAFLFLLNVLALLGNDCLDVDQDLASPNRDHVKPAFLKAHMREAVAAQVALGALLAAVALIAGGGLIAVLLIGEANCLLYSWKLKRMPVADVLSIGLWGLIMPAACFPPDSAMGWCLAGQLFFFSAAFEILQVMRDREEDVRHGVSTSAVRLGHARSVVLLRLVIVAAAAYGVLLVHQYLCAGVLVALLVPVRRGSEAAAWDRLRLVLGVVWLAVIGWILATGSTDGLVADVAAGDVIGWPWPR